jgi:hypothetical protein
MHFNNSLSTKRKGHIQNMIPNGKIMHIIIRQTINNNIGLFIYELVKLFILLHTIFVK